MCLVQLASANGCRNLVKLLLEYDCDWSTASEYNETALDLAKEFKREVRTLSL